MGLISGLAVVAILVGVLIISTMWTNKYGAPWVPTSTKKVHRMLQMAKVGPDDLVFDLGCGDGRILAIAARHYGAKAVGIEIDLLRYLWCQILITILGLRDRVQLIYGDFFTEDLSKADVVICYLLPSTNEKLQEKLGQELHTNTRIVSHKFSFPNLQLQQKDYEHNLYLYHPKS